MLRRICWLVFLAVPSILLLDDVNLSAAPPLVAGAKAGAETEIAGVKLCWCPAGKFMMGSPAGEAERRDDEKQVEVRHTRGFWIGKFEVTQGQWRKYVGEFPDKQPTEQWGQGDDYPLYWVNLPEAETFCQKLTAAARVAGELPEGWEFRLPTEAQWEYACRAGTTGATSFGDTLSSKQASIDGTKPMIAEQGPKLGGSAKVGSYPANAWNIHDMPGNVFEWTRDWYHTTLPGGDDPEATTKGLPNRDGTYSRVRRGGAWCEEGRHCRAAFRLRFEPDRRSDHIGFRVVAVEK